MEAITINDKYFQVFSNWHRMIVAGLPKTDIDRYYYENKDILVRSALNEKCIDYNYIMQFKSRERILTNLACLPIGADDSTIWVLYGATNEVKHDDTCAFSLADECGCEMPPHVAEKVKVLINAVTSKKSGAGAKRNFGAPLRVEFLCTTREIVDSAIDFCLRTENIIETGPGDQTRSEVTIIEPVEVPDVDTAAIDRVLSWLRNAINRGATDIHIEPTETGGCVRLRIDGVLDETESMVRVSFMRQIISWLKVQADVDITEQRRALDGKMKLARFVNGKCFEVDVRFSSIPTIYGEKVVLRLLDKSKQADKYVQEGGLRGVFPPGDEGEEVFDVFTDALSYGNGIVLVTGPTGCGKTTTLNTSLRHMLDIHGKRKNIVTVEDPVEYTVPGASQVQTNDLAGLTFANSLRSILRQDPDIVLVGEIRDSETADVAVQASLTGHLILSTLHTNDAIGCVERLRDLGVSPFLIGSTVRLFQAQRLVRLLCPGENPPEGVKGCARRLSEHETEERVMKSRLAPYIARFVGKAVWDYRDNGCAYCGNMGFKGRRAVMEVIPIRHELRDSIQQEEPRNRMLQVARKACGLRSMVECGIDLVLAGKTSIAQVEEFETGDGKLILSET